MFTTPIHVDGFSKEHTIKVGKPRLDSGATRNNMKNIHHLT